MFRPVLAAGAIVLAAGMLTGCSLSPAPTTTSSSSAAPEGQTAKEACDEILPVFLDVSDRLQGAYSELSADPAKAGPLLHDISDDMHASLDGLENEEVSEVMGTAVDSLDAMIVEIDKAIAGTPDQDALIAAANQVQVDFSAVDPVCQAAG